MRRKKGRVLGSWVWGQRLAPRVFYNSFLKGACNGCRDGAARNTERVLGRIVEAIITKTIPLEWISYSRIAATGRLRRRIAEAVLFQIGHRAQRGIVLRRRHLWREPQTEPRHQRLNRQDRNYKNDNPSRKRLEAFAKTEWLRRHVQQIADRPRQQIRREDAQTIRPPVPAIFARIHCGMFRDSSAGSIVKIRRIAGGLVAPVVNFTAESQTDMGRVRRALRAIGICCASRKTFARPL